MFCMYIRDFSYQFSQFSICGGCGAKFVPSFQFAPEFVDCWLEMASGVVAAWVRVDVWTGVVASWVGVTWRLPET